MRIITSVILFQILILQSGSNITINPLKSLEQKKCLHQQLIFKEQHYCTTTSNALNTELKHCQFILSEASKYTIRAKFKLNADNDNLTKTNYEETIIMTFRIASSPSMICDFYYHRPNAVLKIRIRKLNQDFSIISLFDQAIVNTSHPDFFLLTDNESVIMISFDLNKDSPEISYILGGIYIIDDIPVVRVIK